MPMRLRILSMIPPYRVCFLESFSDRVSGDSKEIDSLEPVLKLTAAASKNADAGTGLCNKNQCCAPFQEIICDSEILYGILISSAETAIARHSQILSSNWACCLSFPISAQK